MSDTQTDGRLDLIARMAIRAKSDFKDAEEILAIIEKLDKAATEDLRQRVSHAVGKVLCFKPASHQVNADTITALTAALGEEGKMVRDYTMPFCGGARSYWRFGALNVYLELKEGEE